MNNCEVCCKPHNNKRFCSIKCRNSVIQKMALQAKADRAFTVNCYTCSVLFKPGNKARKYCSRKCFYKSKSTPLERVCEQCGCMFDQISPSGLKKSRRFCNRSCAMRYVGLNKIHPKWSEERRANHMKSMPRGENHVFWRGGVTPWQKRERKKPEYAKWRTLVFERDNYTCVICGVRGGELNADHIKSWIKYPELRLDLDNGRTLCVPCHRKTPTYARNLKYQD